MTLSNLACAQRFAHGRAGKAAHARSYGDALWSYSTCIARRLGPGLYVLNVERYSHTTSSHQRSVASALEDGARVIEVENAATGIDLTETDLLHRSFDAFHRARREALGRARRARSIYRRQCHRADAAVAAERLRRIRAAQRALARPLCPASRTLAAIAGEPAHDHGLRCLAHARLRGLRGAAEDVVRARESPQRVFDAPEPPEPPPRDPAPWKPYQPPPSQADLSRFAPPEVRHE